MNRRIPLLAVLALALASCATYNAGQADGSYKGAYDGGYYAPAQDGNGDYYYDNPEVVVNEYGPGYSSFYPGFGFGFLPWWGYGGWYGWCGRGGWWHHHYVWTGQRGPRFQAGHFPQHPALFHSGAHTAPHMGHIGPSH